MKLSTETAIIIILTSVIAVLSLMLIQNQNIINSQREVIASQEQQINELKNEAAKAEALSPESLIENVKGVVRKEGFQFLNNLSDEIRQDLNL